MISRISFRLVISALLISVCSITSLCAQDKKDFTSWANVGLKYKVVQDFAISGNVEWRTKDNLEKTDRWGLGVGGKYTLLPFLNIGAGYEMHYRNRGEEGWKFRHRYFLDGTLSTSLMGFKLSLRERLQHTINNGYDEFRLRSRAEVAYEISKCKLEPYISVEMYNGLNRGDKFDITRMRYRGGVVLPLSSRWEADFFYCRQWEEDKRKDIIGVTCNYSF